MSLHPGEAGYEQQEAKHIRRIIERASDAVLETYARAKHSCDGPDTEQSCWPCLAGKEKVKRAAQPAAKIAGHVVRGDISFADIAELVNEAMQSCRCDGGCNDCAACRAERKLKAHDIPTDAESLKIMRARLTGYLATQTARFSSTQPNQTNTPKHKAEIINHIEIEVASPNTVVYRVNDSEVPRERFLVAQDILRQEALMPPCRLKPQSEWCDHAGPGGFMGHTCFASVVTKPEPETFIGYKVLVNHDLPQGTMMVSADVWHGMQKYFKVKP